MKDKCKNIIIKCGIKAILSKERDTAVFQVWLKRWHLGNVSSCCRIQTRTVLGSELLNHVHLSQSQSEFQQQRQVGHNESEKLKE